MYMMARTTMTRNNDREKSSGLTLDVAPGESGSCHLLPEVGFGGGPSASLLQAASLLLLLAQLGSLQPLY